MSDSIVCTIDANGIHAPAYADVLAYLQDAYQGIYGADVYLGNDSQDGQWLAVIAAAINDANSATVAAYSNYAPTTAQGAGLSSAVKINGIARQPSSNSTAAIAIVGTVGATILNGSVRDGNGNLWTLPASVVIPSGGTITVEAICQTAGAVAAAPNTINQIATPTLGWASATNPADAAAGVNAESDAALRVRQQVSVANPALTVIESIQGAILGLAGVTACTIYENTGSTTDGNGLPGHSIAAVVTGGDPQAIAQQIYLRKTPGAATYGTTSETVVDNQGIPRTINFFVTADVRVIAQVTIVPGTGYASSIGVQIQQALSAAVDALAIGQDVQFTRLYLPALLNGLPAGQTYELTSVEIAIYPNAVAAADVTIPFNEEAQLAVSDVTIVT